MANGRMSHMTSANARLFVLLAEHTPDSGLFRRIHDLRLLQSHLPLFIMPWTLVHVIDETSALYGHTAETLEAAAARIFVTIEARDQALAAQVQDMQDYALEHIRFGMHFADAVVMDEQGHSTADLSRISLMEPDAPV
jgi:inward rectifier potassium channel